MTYAIEDGKDAIAINNIHKYCYDHYKIYDSLRKLYTEVSKSHNSLSWNDFLTNVLDVNYKESWKELLRMLSLTIKTKIWMELNLDKGGKICRKTFRRLRERWKKKADM